LDRSFSASEMARRRSQSLAVLLLAALALTAWRTAEHGFIPGPSAGASPAGRQFPFEAASGAVSAAAGMAAGMAAAIGSLPATAADTAADSGNSGDWFQPVVDLNANVIESIDGIVGSVGAAIILYTILIKVVTWPIQSRAVASAAKIQLVAPEAEQITKEYRSNETKKNKALQLLYAKVGLNPLDAFASALLQIPIFIGLFRAIGQLAKQDEHFKESFLFLTSLSGPIPPGGSPGLDWLLRTKSGDYFEPLVGWPAAQGYLAMTVLVVVSQLLLARLQATSKEPGPAENLFPVFIGISTLVSPAGLSLYWLTNNVLTAAQTIYLQAQLAEEFPELKKLKEQWDAESPEDAVRYTRRASLQEDTAAEKKAKSVEEAPSSSKKMKPKKSKPPRSKQKSSQR